MRHIKTHADTNHLKTINKEMKDGKDWKC